MQDPDGRARVLIVDDSATNRIKMATVVGNLGHATETAEDGQAALDLLRQGGIDLVLLDIMMPNIDGYEVLRQMRAEEALKELPVLVVSSLDDLADVVQGIQLGAQDFLTKSFDPIVFRARVTACLEQKRLRDQELAYLRDVRRLTSAAAAIEATSDASTLPDLDAVSRREDGLGRLSRVFTEMADEVARRDAGFRDRITLLKGTFLLLVIGLFWGLAPTLSHIIVAEADQPFALSAYVALTSALLMTTMALLSGRLQRPSAQTLRFSLIVGLIGGALPTLALLVVASHVSAGIISVLLAMEAVFVFVLAVAFRTEMPDWRRFSGLLFGLICVLLLVLPGESSDAIGSPVWLLVVLFIPLGYAGETLAYSIWPRRDADPLLIATLCMIMAAGWLWGLAAILGETVPIRDLTDRLALPILAFALLSCATTYLLILAVQRTGAVFAGQTAYITAAMGMIWAILLLDETPSVWVWLALACLAAGLILVQPRMSGANSDVTNAEKDAPV